MSDSLRAKAAAAIKSARAPDADRQPQSAAVTLKNLSFSLNPKQSEWLEGLAAETKRALDQA